MDPINPRSYEHLSPFEIKDELIRLARTSAETTAAHAFLNAGRGNPNWVATRARQIFFTLGQFALDEATRVMAHPTGIAGMPRAAGIADRLHAWLGDRKEAVIGALLQDAVEQFGFQSDAFIHELVDAIIGDNYPVPDRMLVHAEQVVHEYLIQAMCGMPRPPGRFDLFATEGGTAAICYIFRSLKANRLLKPGDRIALGTPIFTPYLEIPQLEDYGLEPVYVDAPQDNGFQFTDAELAKLEDPRVKAFFLVNPGNPTSVTISPAVRTSIANLVRTRRPDLMLITDDVYATFVDDFRSLMGELPHNTI
ncbi:MAG TPA: bifunctional aspartate transaminase/aspartate 4-decarboxylase, partial [Xanthobacteraceae bacterium]|nr:bifunctional aspartate transaminase/aspartate 4-decarboxylase [Xanthobacteraceae bacterium]